jgi:hypothetical protein
MRFTIFKYAVMVLGLLITVQLTAQMQATCGTVEDAEHIARLRAHVDAMMQKPLLMRSVVQKYVPLRFILVGDDNGNGHAKYEQVLEQVAALNEMYAPQDMLFYIASVIYEDNSNIYNDPAETISTFRMNQINDDEAMNVFVTLSANTPGTQPNEQTQGYHSSQFDWLVMRKEQLKASSQVLAHEIGHFFSLAHTFRGWGCQPYDEETHGNPVTSFWSPCNGQLRIEYQDASNCTFAGDFLCDTPPDYNFGFGWSVGGDRCAEYDAGTMDPVGTVVDPMENNFMSYFFECDNYAFTPMQMEVIEEDFLSPQRAYLRTGYVPIQDPVIDEVVYNFPINDEESSSFNSVELDWNDVDGATHYLVILDRFATFSFQPTRFVVEESNVIIDELTPGVRYYWKVWPFNESQTGAGYSGVQQFIAGMSSSVNEIPQVEYFNVYPNPVRNGQFLLTIDASSAFDAELQMIDAAGRILSRSQEDAIGGSWQKEVDVSTLTPGMYFLRLIASDGILMSKVTVY